MQKKIPTFFRKFFLFFLPIAILAAGTAALFLFVRSQEDRRIQLQFEWQTAIMFNGLKAILESQHHVLNSLQAVSNAADLDRKTFQQFASNLLTLYPDVQALEWIPRVEGARRTEYESLVAREGFSGFQIREYDHEKKLVRAGSRPEYYPADYIVPLAPNERAFGFDLASDPVRREALLLACETNDFVATGRITLIQEKERQYGFLTFAPVYRKDAAHETADERRRNLSGFVSVVFRAGDLLDGFFKGIQTEGITIQVFCDASLTPENLLYSSGLSEGQGRPLERIMALPFAGRTWALRFVLPATAIAAQRTLYPFMVFAVGMFITVLLGAFLKVIAGRSETIQNLVEQRTAELQETTVRLLSAQARQKAILENIPYFAWLKDRESRFLEVNELFARSCGFPVAAIIGKTDLDIWPRELAERYRADDCEVMESGKPKFVEEPIADSGGTQWFETFKTPVFDKKGEVIGTTGLARDITERKLLEDELNIQRKRSENVIAGTNAGIWDWNVETGETIFNERWAEIAGYTLPELSPVSIQTWINLTHPDDLHRSNDLLARHFAGELEYYSCECRMHHKDGTWVWVHDRGKVFEWTADGKPLRMMGMHVDITMRKSIDEEVRRQRALLASLLDSMPDIIFFKDMHGIYLGCNPVFSDLVGRPRDEIVGRTDHDLFEKQIADFFRDNDQKMIEIRSPRYNEEWITYPDGSRILLDTLKTPYWGPDGELLGVLGISRDITERKRIEETLTRHVEELARINNDLSREKEQTELILNDVGDGVAVTDMKGQIVMINNVAKNLLGVTGSVLEGSTVNELFAHCSLTEQQKHIIYSHILPESFSTTVTAETPLELDIKCTTLHDANRSSAGQVYVFHDVTRMKEIDRMKSNFISSVSHELRTPLTSIKGFVATILKDPQISEQIRFDFLSIVDKEADRLIYLIEDILEISRIETGKIEICARLYTIDEIVQKMQPSFKKLAEDKEQQLDFTIQQGLPALTGDIDKIYSVLSNLLANAVKFTPPEGRILFSAFQKGDYVVAQITDTGLGIPEKDIKHIFERFYRVYRPGTQIPGTGLGLAICKELVHLHGGHIEVKSILDQGTVFSVYFPIIVKTDDTPVAVS